MPKVNGNGETKFRHLRSLRHKAKDGDRYPQGWNELGDFIVSFGFIERFGRRHLQTRAYYSQGDQLTVWDGVVKQEVLDWMFKQAEAFLPPEALPPKHEVLDMEIVDLHLAEVKTGMLATGRLRMYHPRHHEGQSGGGGAEFRTELFVVDQATGAEMRVAEQKDSFEKDELARDIRVVFPKPGVGRYQVKAVVSLTEPAKGSGVIATEALGPILRVE